MNVEWCHVFVAGSKERRQMHAHPSLSHSLTHSMSVILRREERRDHFQTYHLLLIEMCIKTTECVREEEMPYHKLHLTHTS